MRNCSKTWYKVKGKPSLQKSNTLLKTTNGTIIPHEGTTTVKNISWRQNCNCNSLIHCSHQVHTAIRVKHLYQQVQLEEQSSDLCAFSTPFGRYKFLRISFGISSASEVLQKKVYQVFHHIDGAYIEADDMLIAAENDEEHGKILHRVLQTAREELRC